MSHTPVHPVRFSGYVRTDGICTPAEAIAAAGGIRPGAVFYADHIAKAVDDYLLMERKARAWDAAVAALAKDVMPGMRVDPSLLDLMRAAIAKAAQP